MLGGCMFNKISPLAGHILVENLNDRGSVCRLRPHWEFGGDLVQDYIEFKVSIVNNFNKINYICNSLHIYMK